jgi:hypothetical protein
MRESYRIAGEVLFGHPVGDDSKAENGDRSSAMDPENKPQDPPNQSSEGPKRRPTTGELFLAWREGGEAKLMEMLPDEPDEDVE